MKLWIVPTRRLMLTLALLYRLSCRVARFRPSLEDALDREHPPPLPEGFTVDVQFKRGKSMFAEEYRNDLIKQHFLVRRPALWSICLPASCLLTRPVPLCKSASLPVGRRNDPRQGLRRLRPSDDGCPLPAARRPSHRSDGLRGGLLGGSYARGVSTSSERFLLVL